MATKITGKWRFKKDASGKIRMEEAPRGLSVSERLRQKSSKRVRVVRRVV